jgi:hypothetical protein
MGQVRTAKGKEQRHSQTGNHEGMDRSGLEGKERTHRLESRVRTGKESEWKWSPTFWQVQGYQQVRTGKISQ